MKNENSPWIIVTFKCELCVKCFQNTEVRTRDDFYLKIFLMYVFVCAMCPHPLYPLLLHFFLKFQSHLFLWLPRQLFSPLRFVLSCSRATFLHSSFRVYDSLARCLCAIFNWSPWTLSAFLTLEMANVSTFARKVHAIYMHVRTVRKSQILCLFLHFPNDSANTHPHTHMHTHNTCSRSLFRRSPLSSPSPSQQQYFGALSSSIPWIFLASV